MPCTQLGIAAIGVKDAGIRIRVEKGLGDTSLEICRRQLLWRSANLNQNHAIGRRRNNQLIFLRNHAEGHIPVVRRL
jgi:hypothetical protein